jgi:hypothetical protein
MDKGGRFNEQRPLCRHECRQERSGIEINPGGQDQQDRAAAAGRASKQKPIKRGAAAGEPRAIDRRLFGAMLCGVDDHP